MKRPAFQFYPADWRKDMALQSCSVAARGLWMDMLCIAHECEPYGHLTVNGKPMTPAQIGRHTGLTERECAKLVSELEEAGVVSRTDEGAIYSRRMVRDEDLRNRRAEGGKAGSEHGAKGAEHGIKGGRPKKVRGVFEPPSEPPPSSSSSSSSSETPEVLQSEQRASEPDTQVHQPTPAGAICRAMKAKGVHDVNPGHPLLLQLIAQGATPAEFEGAAMDAAGRGKGFAYTLAALQGRRKDAATVQLEPAKPKDEAPAISPAIAATRRLLAERESVTPTKPPAEVLAMVGRIGKIAQ